MWLLIIFLYNNLRYNNFAFTLCYTTYMPILTYEAYAHLKHPTPYKLTLQSGANVLYYFGERHLFAPIDPQWDELKAYWNEFLTQTAGHKRIVFTEGGVRDVKASEEQAIIQDGGMGLVTFLAHQSHIEIHSPEPDEAYERTELEKQFSRDTIQYYYFARVVYQWGRKQEPKPDFVKYISRYLQHDAEKSGWDDYDFSLVHMTSLHSELFQTEFDERDTKFFSEISNPLLHISDINRVSEASGLVRDAYIVQEIQTYIDNGYSIFAQFGCSHVVMQEPLLREVLGR
jgi:hypothetical protein